MRAQSGLEAWENPGAGFQEIIQFLRLPLQSLLERKIAQNEEKLLRYQISINRNQT